MRHDCRPQGELKENMHQMICLRCQGSTVTEVFVDWSSGGGFLSFPGQRCLSCGDITDAVIMANRHITPRPLLPKARHRTGTIL